MQKNEIFKNIPSVHDILSCDEIMELSKKYKTDILKKIINLVLNNYKKYISQNINNSDIINDLSKDNILKTIRLNVKSEIDKLENKFIKVINATGIISHTNLGRSPINYDSLNKSNELSSSYMNIEYDINTTNRLDRNHPIRDIIRLLFDVEDAIVVNNNASSLLLIFDTFGKGKNTLISRGELIEIGDNFRALDIIKCTDTIVKEVGSTNRTYTRDYEENIDENTSLIMKISKSNYEINGFTSEVKAKELSQICKKNNILFVEDLGSGNILDLENYNLKYERTIYDSIDDGADLICFSSDKMLGSCQAGIIIGKREYVQKLRKNPMFRALRAGKTIITTLYESLKSYTYTDFEHKIPILDMISMPKDVIYKKAEKLYNLLINKDIFSNIQIKKSDAYIGGGVSSKSKIDSYCIILQCKNLSVNQIEQFLRTSDKHIISYIKNNNIVLDLICLSDDDIYMISQCFDKIKDLIDIQKLKK